MPIQLTEGQAARYEKIRGKIQNGVAHLLEPGETVQAGVWGQSAIPTGIYLIAIVALTPLAAIAILPVFIQTGRLVVRTERNIYVIKPKGLSSFSGKEVVAKYPLGSVPAAVTGPAFPGRSLVVGDLKLYLQLGKVIIAAATAIAADAQR